MTNVRRRKVAAGVAMFVAAAGPAAAETLVASDFHTRLVLAFRVAEAPLAKRFPEGWESSPIPAGPNRGANLLVSCVDRVLNLDPEGKPVAGGRDRYVTVTLPAKRTDGSASGVFAMRIYTDNAAILPGAYGTSVLAQVRRAHSGEGSGTALGNATESCDMREPVSKSVFIAKVAYERATATRAQAEQRVYSPVTPDFYRIYRSDQGTEVIRSQALKVDNRDGFELTVDLPEFGDLFDGTESVMGITVLPWSLRHIWLP